MLKKTIFFIPQYVKARYLSYHETNRTEGAKTLYSGFLCLKMLISMNFPELNSPLGSKESLLSNRQEGALVPVLQGCEKNILNCMWCALGSVQG